LAPTFDAGSTRNGDFSKYNKFSAYHGLHCIASGGDGFKIMHFAIFIVLCRTKFYPHPRYPTLTMKTKAWLPRFGLLPQSEARRITLAVTLLAEFVLSRWRVGNGILSRRTPVRFGGSRAHAPIHSVRVLAAMLALSILSPGPAHAQSIVGSGDIKAPPQQPSQPSPWTISGSLLVGYNGTGAPTTQNGGTVSDTEGRIGRRQTTNGTVMVRGAGSAWNQQRRYPCPQLGKGHAYRELEPE
jgi:hypothetical protein